MHLTNLMSKSCHPTCQVSNLNKESTSWSFLERHSISFSNTTITFTSKCSSRDLLAPSRSKQSVSTKCFSLSGLTEWVFLRVSWEPSTNSSGSNLTISVRNSSSMTPSKTCFRSKLRSSTETRQSWMESTHTNGPLK